MFRVKAKDYRKCRAEEGSESCGKKSLPLDLDKNSMQYQPCAQGQESHSVDKMLVSTASRRFSVCTKYRLSRWLIRL